MAFESVNVTSARNALNSCLNTISYSKSSRIYVNIQNNEIWNSSSRDVLKEALKTLTNIKYKELKDKINTYLLAINQIEGYQNAQASLNEVNNQIKELESKISTAKSNKRSYERNKEKYSSKLSQTKKDIYNYSNQLTQLYNRRRELENEMASLKSQIELKINS